MHTEHHNDLSENKAMPRIFYTPLYAFIFMLCAMLQARAQPESNLLGLPVVPQKPASAAPAPAPAANASAARTTASGTGPAAAVPLTDAQIKSVINGGVTMASSYVQRVATVRVTTNTVYASQEQRKTALSAARLVQRDLRTVCGKQCKPAAKMPAPAILPDGKLQFDLVIEDIPRALSNEDMVAMVVGNPLAVLPNTTPTAATPTTAPPTTTTSSAPATPAATPASATQ
jgi:hypothetical protein